MRKDVLKYKKLLESRGFQVITSGKQHLIVKFQGVRVMTLSSTPGNPKHWEKRAEGDIKRFFAQRAESLNAPSAGALTSRGRDVLEHAPQSARRSTRK